MAKGTGETGENPLVPNAKLRRMYTTMLEARTLEEAVSKRVRVAKKRTKIVSITGQEAVRVSTTIELGGEDLVSDVAPSAAMALILGGHATSLLDDFSRTNGKKTKADGTNRLLPTIEDTEERLRVAVGAAAALKTQKKSGVVVAYARKGEATTSVWKRVLGVAAKLELPVIFVVLPKTGAAKKGDDLAEVCGAARAAGVPSFPVDACDAVALYRVAQESLGRTRGGDGPVLVECVGWRVEGKRLTPDDPLEHLKAFLLARKIAIPAWFQQAERAARKQLLRKRRLSKS
jgi:TPP-dependent pyruvate/acetoin dehydrogenase alpha subunit